MARFSAVATTAAALANGNAVIALVPNASTNVKLRRLIIGVVNTVGAVSDTQLSVGINRATARGTSSATATVNKLDPLSLATGSIVDTGWSVQPTLAATDGYQWGFNTRGGLDVSFGAEAGAADFASTTGTANAIVIVQRSGAALPASHSLVATLEFEE